MTRSTLSRKSLLTLCVSALALAACSDGGHAGHDKAQDKASAGEASHAGHKTADHKGGDHSQHMLKEASRGGVPDYAENFRLVDHKGDSHELFYHTDAKAIVIMTHGNGCPIVRSAIPDLRNVRDQFAGEGVEFMLINSNLQDDRDEVAAEAAEYNIDFPIMMDDHQLIGESLGVDRTAQVYVIDPAQGFKVVYHGPLDDRQAFERQKAEADKTYVADVLAQMVAGEEVTVQPPAISPGCLVNFPERKRQSAHMNISYSKEIAPMLLENCAECHQEGGIGPWAMTDYETIEGWAPMMREVIRTDRMPPWHADPHIGTFKEDRSLSSDEIKTLIHWIEAGAPRGDGPDPLAEANLVYTDWPLGEPDLIIDLPEYAVPATGVVDYTHPLVLNPLKEEKWIKATTIKVGSRETVHHVLSGYIPEVPDDGMGYSNRWVSSTGGYAVGAESNIAPEDSGVQLPPGGAIGFQMHYTPYGKEVVDKTQIGFYFHDDTPTYINRQSVVIDVSIVLPPNEARHEEVAYLEFPHDAELIMAFPHAHYRGHASRLTLEYPDGTEKVLLNMPKYDFNWQRGYEFEEFIDVPKGSKLIAHWVYDNSANNPANPDPDKTVVWGDQSHEEMLYTAFNYRWKGETSDNRMDKYTAQLQAGRHFGAMDDNMDGILEEAELKGVLGKEMMPLYKQMDIDKNGEVRIDEFRTVLLGIEMMKKARGQQ